MIRVAAAAAMAVLASSNSADATENPDGFGRALSTHEPLSLTADWNGTRDRLLDRGISFQLGYVNELAYNVQGGLRKVFASADQYLVGSTFDLDRLVGLYDGRFQVSFTLRTGRNLSDDAELGTLQEVQEIFGRGRTVRLTEFWFEQTYVDGLLDWKVGRAPFEDFAAFECNFQNLTFCGPGPGNVVPQYIWNWPISQWMTRLKLNLSESSYLQVAVYDQNQKYLGTRDALLPVFFRGSSGVLVPIEFAWLPAFGVEGLAGSYKIGAWYDTSKASDVLDTFGYFGTNPDAATLSRGGRFGGYLNFKQQIVAGGSGRGGLSVFLNAFAADDRTSTVDHQITGGVTFIGPFTERPKDDIAFAVGATHVNGRLAAAEQSKSANIANPSAKRDYEYVFEIYYTIRATERLSVRPNLQYVLNPGGTSRHTDAAVIGLKTALDL